MFSTHLLIYLYFIYMNGDRNEVEGLWNAQPKNLTTASFK